MNIPAQKTNNSIKSAFNYGKNILLERLKKAHIKIFWKLKKK